MYPLPFDHTNQHYIKPETTTRQLNAYLRESYTKNSLIKQACEQQNTSKITFLIIKNIVQIVVISLCEYLL